MANTKKKTGGKKSNNTKKTTSASKAAQTRKLNAKKAQQHKKVVREINFWIAIGVALFLFLSNFGICGIVGNFLKEAMLGCFGWMGYLFPIVLAVTVALLVYNDINSKIASKIICDIGLFVDLCTLLHLLSYGGSGESVLTFYKEGAKSIFGGGIVGGAIGKMLHSLLGLTGTYIVVLVILIICVVVLTEKSIMSFIKNRGKDAYENAAAEAEIRREANALEKEQRRQEKAQRREEKLRQERERLNQKKQGVDFSAAALEEKIDIEPEKIENNDQNVHEIHIEGLDDEDGNEVLQDDTVYTYNDAVNTKDKRPSAPAEAKNDEHATDGEFTPKEEVKKASSEGKIIAPKKKKLKYRKPSYDLLKDSGTSSNKTTRVALMETANKLKQVLANFGVKVEITNVSRGPSVTRYELQPEMGTKVSRITGLADDIKLNMAAADIRIEAPIPGKAAVGIEIPNKGRDSVCLKELLMSKELKNHKSKLAFPAGKDIAGKVVVADIAKMPHMLIAGTTGSGKSVFTNSILMSILYRTTPEEVRLIVIDPKVVEFQVYNKIPHLLYDVVTDPKKAAGILNWAVAEMTTRYNKFAKAGARDIGSYNVKVEAGQVVDDFGEPAEKMPQILIVIDELADLMMVAAKEVEEAICRLAQLARAAGIHMVIATQRPSVDVITGLIKANIPSRVALTVASGTDSRTIIDMNGAEKLLGNGDMLFYPAGYVKPVRVQGAYVSDQEIFDTVEFIKNNSGEAEYDQSIDAKLTTDQEAMSNDGNERDPLFADAGRLCIEKQKGSTSMIQRQFRVGFNRAARIMEQLYDAGVVGQEETNKPRKVIMSIEDFENIL